MHTNTTLYCRMPLPINLVHCLRSSCGRGQDQPFNMKSQSHNRPKLLATPLLQGEKKVLTCVFSLTVPFPPSSLLPQRRPSALNTSTLQVQTSMPCYAAKLLNLSEIGAHVESSAFCTNSGAKYQVLRAFRTNCSVHCRLQCIAPLLDRRRTHI
jgi:hypothetical protein